MHHNRKDKRYKYLAYTQTFADIFVPILLFVIIGTGTARRNKIFSRVSPIFMTPIMIQQINPEQPYQQQLSL